MRSAYLETLSGQDPEARRRRIALAVVIGGHALIVALLLLLGRFEPLPPPPEPATMTLVPVAAPEAEQAEADTAEAETTEKSTPPPVAAPPARKVPQVPKLPKVDALDIDFDLAKAPPAPSPPAAAPAETATASAATGTGTGAVYGPVLGKRTGPGGATLYPAEWYIEPTNAELAGYLPERGPPPGSYATIACRTIPNFRVEDCTELEESPVGSGLARAVRQAGWQFRVRPPQIDGKPQVGEWVRIRISFTASGKVEP